MPTPTQSSPTPSVVVRHPKHQRAGWTPERRLRQAEAIRRWRPWARSTGPRTVQGKARARLNAVKHGLYTQAMRRIRKALKMQARFLAAYCYVKKTSACAHAGSGGMDHARTHPSRPPPFRGKIYVLAGTDY